MYKGVQNKQIELTVFNQPYVFKTNPLYCWINKAYTYLWTELDILVIGNHLSGKKETNIPEYLKPIESAIRS